MEDFYANVNEHLEENAGLYLAMGGLSALQTQEKQAHRASKERQRLIASLEKLEEQKAKAISVRRILVGLDSTLEEAEQIPLYQVACDCGWDPEFYLELVKENEDNLETVEDMKYFESLYKRWRVLAEKMKPICDRQNLLTSDLKDCFYASLEGRGDIFDVFYSACSQGETSFLEDVSRGFTTQLKALINEGRDIEEVKIMFQSATTVVIPQDSIFLDDEGNKPKLNESILRLAEEVIVARDLNHDGDYFMIKFKRTFSKKEIQLEPKKDLRLLLDFDLYGTELSKEVARLKSGVTAAESRSGNTFKYFRGLNDVLTGKTKR